MAEINMEKAAQDVARKAMQELRNAGVFVSRWIPVSEELPEHRELVLFSTRTDNVFEGRYFADNTDRQWYAFRDEAFAWNDVVTAWMRLPEPYRAERE